MAPTPALVSWSSGKDSAWALHVLRQQPQIYDVRGVFTTVSDTCERVSIHSTPLWVLREQAVRLELPLYEIALPYPCSNTAYEEAMERFLARMRALPRHLAATHLAFGDLFLEDIRSYREDRLAGTGLEPIFPVWGRDTAELAEEMLSSGVRAIVNSVNPAALPDRFAGRQFDRAFIADLPAGTDPLGENGEFHTCVVEGPMFSAPIDALPGPVVRREVVKADEDGQSSQARDPHPTYVYADLLRPD